MYRFDRNTTMCSDFILNTVRYAREMWSAGYLSQWLVREVGRYSTWDKDKGIWRKVKRTIVSAIRAFR